MIDAHIIPDNVLFLGPTNENEQFKTLAFTDMLKVVAFLSSAEEGDKTKCKKLLNCCKLIKFIRYF